MARPRRIRSVSEIRSSSSVTTTNTGIHKIYMRIGSMEMERERRIQERSACLVRAQQCEERCRQLDAEIERMLGEARRRGGSSLPSDTPAVPPAPEPKPAARPAGVSARYDY